MLVVLLWLCLTRLVRLQYPRTARGRRFIPAARPALRLRKPDWVVEEVIRLKAHLAQQGCRKVADTFNRLHAARHGMTVSKTYVATMVRRHRLQIETRRAEWKRRIPSPVEANQVWGLDLTTKGDLAGELHPILGIVDHGSRFAVALRVLPNKAAITLLRALLDALALLGIRHQRTERHCPWQNGRVERFFGTLKERLDGWAVDSLGQLELALADFRSWYNHVRPHQHLGGRTPAEAWRRIDPYAQVPKEVQPFSAWDGMLTGFYLRR